MRNLYIISLVFIGLNLASIDTVFAQLNKTAKKEIENRQSKEDEVKSVHIVRGPYLQKSTSSSVIVRWRTDKATASRVNYGESLGKLNQNVIDLEPKIDHEIEISGLNSSTKYYYNISNDATILLFESEAMFFKTHPDLLKDPLKPYTFWILGDAGMANDGQRDVRDAYYKYKGLQDTDGILLLGDNAYNDGTDSQYQEGVFNIYKDILKNTVTWSCFGNHDAISADSNTQSGPYYDIFSFPTKGESGGVPSNTEAYYSFNYGNVHFIVLDSSESDLSEGGDMYNWCKNDIKNATQQWIIAYWHDPPYSKGSHDSDKEGEMISMRENFLPILEKHSVDIVFTGHSHGYERSYFLNGHYGNSETFDKNIHIVGNDKGNDEMYLKDDSKNASGTVYVVAGASGELGRLIGRHNAMVKPLYQLGSCVMEVNKNILNVKYITDTGAVGDHFTIKKECKK